MSGIIIPEWATVMRAIFALIACAVFIYYAHVRDWQWRQLRVQLSVALLVIFGCEAIRSTALWLVYIARRSPDLDPIRVSAIAFPIQIAAAMIGSVALLAVIRAMTFEVCRGRAWLLSAGFATIANVAAWFLT